MYNHINEDLEDIDTMKSVQVSSKMAQNVKDFVNLAQKYPFEIDLRSGRYLIDAKSILGIFSLDLSKPINVEIHCDDCDELIEQLKAFSIK